MRAGMRSTTCCFAEVRAASILAEVCVFEDEDTIRPCELVLPVGFVIFFHRRRAVSHGPGRKRYRSRWLSSSRAAEDFGWGTFPPLVSWFKPTPGMRRYCSLISR